MELKRLAVIGAMGGVFLGSGSVHALPDLKPAAEAKGTKAPVELTLRLYQTKIKADESLWGQIEIKNVGKADITVSDDMFFKPYPIADQSEPHPIHVAVFDAAGKRVKPRSGIYDFHGGAIPRRLSEVDPEEDRKIGIMIDGWKKAGLSKEDIDEKLREYDDKKYRDEKDAEMSSRNSQVAPGSSLKSRPWAHDDRDPNGDEPQTPPVGQFSELKYYFEKPGKYTIRAVYDYRMSERAKKLLKRRVPSDTDILVKTKPISFEVIP